MTEPTTDRDAEGTRILAGPDGLTELDNPTPRWMGLVYVGTLVWGVGYLMCMPGVGMNGLGWTQYGDYRREVAVAAAAAPARSEDASQLAAGLATKPEAVAAGKAVFASNCAACHGAEAKGAIGPNLTDATWLYGGRPADIAHTIMQGTKKGMPSFQGALSARQIAEAASFVHSLGGGR